MDTERLARAWELLQEAYKYQMEGDYELAVDLYQRSIETFPTAEAHTFLGWTYHFQGKLDQAIRECHRAIELDPDFGNTYNDMGDYLIEKNQYDEAITWLEKALRSKRYDSYHYPHYNLGRAYLAKDMLNRARECFQRALEIAPDYELARQALENLRKRVMQARPVSGPFHGCYRNRSRRKQAVPRAARQPDQHQHDRHFNQWAHDCRQGYSGVERRNRDCDRDLKIPAGRIEGHRNRILVAEAQLPAGQVHDGEHAPEEKRHGNGQLQNDSRALDDQVALQREQHHQREQQPHNRERVEKTLHFAESALAVLSDDPAAGHHASDQRDTQIEHHAFGHDPDVELHVAEQPVGVDRDQRHLQDRIHRDQNDG